MVRLSVAEDNGPERVPELTPEQRRRRRNRSIGLALALGALVLIMIAITLVKGPATFIRPL